MRVRYSGSIRTVAPAAPVVVVTVVCPLAIVATSNTAATRMNSFVIGFLLKPHQRGYGKNRFFALLFREEFGAANALHAQIYRPTRSFQCGAPMQAQTGATPSTKISRRSIAVCRTFSASAYSGEAYHSRKRSIVGNSTTMIVFGGGPPSTTLAAPPRTR